MRKAQEDERRTVAVQIGIVLSGFVLIAILPPAEGSLLLVPLRHHRLADSVDLAVAAGAAVEGAGPFAGSLRVSGRRDMLSAAAAGRGYLLLRAGPFQCRG